MFSGRTRTEATRSRSHSAADQPALLRFFVALLMILTLTFTSVGMAGAASAHVTSVSPSIMSHCADEHVSPLEKHADRMIDCAMACAMVQGIVPQLTPRATPVRPVLSMQLSPPLKGVEPDATSPPPRLFPEA